MTEYSRETFIEKFGVTPGGLFDLKKLFTTKIQLECLRHPKEAILTHEFVKTKIPGTDYWFASLVVAWWIDGDGTIIKMRAEVQKITIYESKAEHDYEMEIANQRYAKING